MATLSHSESRRLYSWWWDSHNSPKNSKWLQENLTDMDGKVKSMIKLIEEDADSFARRAEMYYKKRPELMKLVEEFYRAYRALAERYNHATGELRHAHRTIAKAFPDQVPFDLIEDSPSKSSNVDREPHTPEMKLPARALFDPDDFLDFTQGLPNSAEDSEGGMRKRGFKQVSDLFEAKNGNQDLKEQILRETERAGKAESKVQSLKKALADMQAEKEDALLQYQKCLENLSSVEGELKNAHKGSLGLSEKASRAEIEVLTLKKALIQLEVEKNAGLVKHQQHLDKISDLQAMVSQVQGETRGFDKRATEAENEAQISKERISRLELEREEMLQQHKQCLAKISDLEKLISALENKEKLLKARAEKAETEVLELMKVFADMNKEKKASAFRYKCCLERISDLEKDLSLAKQDVERLNREIMIGTAKLKSAEEKCGILETSNRSLRVEADNLSKMIAMKDVEVSEKQEELEKLRTSLQDEQFHHEQIEATLETLQSLHSRSQEDQKALALELQDLLQKLKESEVSKNGLEEVQHAEDMESEIISLQEIKEKLEKEVLHHIGLSNSLQEEIVHLKEEIKGLNLRYHILFEQVEDNSKLRQRSEEDKNEIDALSKRLKDMEAILKQKIVLESSLSNLSNELENSKETVKALQESCQFLREEKRSLASEKASLLSQIQPITENMHKLLERNAVLENSLSTAKVELEGLRERSKGLESICEMLKNERSFLLSERCGLALKLENVEGRLESLEKRYMGLEAKYADVAKEKEAIQCQAKELEVSLRVEKQERASSKLKSETHLAGLENEIHILKEENLWKKKEFEEELEKALKAQFEISILQKFIKEMEEKNYSLIVECQKHVEASKLAEKLISDLESETLEQQVESELLLDEIERLRFGIYQVFRALEEKAGPSLAAVEEKTENEGTFVDHILKNIEDMKFDISKHEDDKQLFLVENSVLLTLLEQLESKGIEIEVQKNDLEKEFNMMATNLAMVKNEKEKLLEINEKLKSDVRERHECNSVLEAELGSYSEKHADLCEAYTVLQTTYSLAKQDNKNLLKKFSDLKGEKFQVDMDNDAVLLEFLAADNQSAVLKSFSMEKIEEVKYLLEDLKTQHEVNDCLEKEMSVLIGNLELRKAENLLLEGSVENFKTEIQEIRECNAEKEANLLDSELKLEAAETFLCSTVDELNADIQESLLVRENLEKKLVILHENNSIQKKEIEGLHFVNSDLNSEICLLREEIEEKTMREHILNSELHEKKNEFEMWEAEASTFYFDLQVSSVREVLFENKVHELTEVCQTLENECVSKTSEVEQMKGKICSMSSEVTGLKSQMSAYAPVVASLKDDISSLEDNVLVQSKLKIDQKQEPELLDVSVHPIDYEILREDQTLLTLQILQERVKTVGKLMEETNKSILHRSKSKKTGEEFSMSEMEQLKPRRSFGKDKNEQSSKKGITPKLQKIKTKASEIKNGMLMKDIPLDHISSMSRQGSRKRGNIGKDDQMLELWETAEDGQSQTIRDSLKMSYKMTEKDIVYDQFENIKHKSDPPSTDSDVEKELGIVSSRSTQANREFNDKKILERLASDAQKLESLQSTVQNLMMKLEANKKIRKVKSVDFDTVNEQLLEADETVVHLVELNGQLLHDIQKCPSPEEKATLQLKEAVKARRKKVTEQARKGSKRIGRLQLELKKIQYILLKMEDDKKNKVKNKFFTSKTVVWRDFMYNGKNSVKRKKGPFCGCFRPSASRNGRSISSL